MLSDLREVVKNWGLEDKVRIKEELVLCPSCKGSSSIEKEELEDYHHREYRRWKEPCTTCNSTGRVYKQTLSLEGFRPFKEAVDAN